MRHAPLSMNIWPNTSRGDVPGYLCIIWVRHPMHDTDQCCMTSLVYGGCSAQADTELHKTFRVSKTMQLTTVILPAWRPRSALKGRNLRDFCE